MQAADTLIVATAAATAATTTATTRTANAKNDHQQLRQGRARRVDREMSPGYLCYKTRRTAKQNAAVTDVARQTKKAYQYT